VVEVAFRTGHPRGEFQIGKTFFEVQRQVGGEWKTIATDADWETKCRWQRAKGSRKGLEFHAFWSVPSDVEPGTCRIVHYGVSRLDGEAGLQRFQATSPEFVIR
jgi:neutral ceramidase